MRRSTLSTTFLSLLPFTTTSTAQTASWGAPFTVDNAATSQQSLLPTSVPGSQSRLSTGSGVSVSLASGSAPPAERKHEYRCYGI
ncbi:hypothetical protein BKA63DRAFT_290281 [Paraphoma chrysanthemicola]|nr:hypothetical protein BKA63DRAFT_290281 [Paraphoma chrysanthemicola]